MQSRFTPRTKQLATLLCVSVVGIFVLLNWNSARAQDLVEVSPNPIIPNCPADFSLVDS